MARQREDWIIPYQIYFRDDATLAAAIAEFGGNIYPGTPTDTIIQWPGINHPPAGQATLVPGPDAPPYPPIYLEYNVPYIAGALILAGDPGFFGGDLFLSLDPSIQGKQVFRWVSDGSGDYERIPARWIWQGTLLKFDGEAGGTGTPPVQEIMQRRWVDGFELPGSFAGEGGSSVTRFYARASSRTTEGMGLCYRSFSGITKTHTLSEFGGPASAQKSWEFLYVRLPVGSTLPSTRQMIWCCNSSAEGDPAVHIYINPSGQLEFYNQGNQLPPGDLLGTSSILTPGQFYRIDLLIKYRNGADLGNLTTYLDKALIFNSGGLNSGFGLGFTQNHTGSRMGERFGTNFGLEIDIDDWVNAEYPATLLGNDWLSGSHMRLVHPTAFVSSVNWTGNFRELLHNPPEGSTAGSVLTSAIASARVEVETDGVDIQIGSPAFLVCLWSRVGGGGATAQLGYTINGGADVLGAITTANDTWNRFMYRPSGLIVPDQIGPLTLIHTKDTVAAAREIKSLFAVVESLGTFGPEDQLVVADESPIPFTGVHNAPYPDSPWAMSALAPESPVMIASGLYSGNNLGEDVLMKIPAHFWWIRSITGGGDPSGVRWISSVIGPHNGVGERPVADLMPQALINSSYVVPGEVSALLRRAGPSTIVNATGITYQWIAVCDPGQRFMLNGAFGHADSITSVVNNLIDSNFTPEAAFFFIEALLGAAGNGIWYKGIGHAANAASALDAAETATAATFGLGAITSKTPLHTTVGGGYMQTAYMAIRRSDGNVDPCGAGFDGPVFGLVTYTGDGTGARNIAVDLGGRFPLFALLVPHNGAAIFRDPSHTGVNSCSVLTGVNIVNGITGGAIDQITVDGAVNTLGVIYDLFVIPGSLNAWENLSSDPEEPFFPVASCIATGGQWTYVAPTPSINLSGIYKVVTGKRNDTVFNTGGASTTDLKIPDPFIKTALLGD